MQLFSIFCIVLLKEDGMKRSALICIVLSVIFVAVALFSYFYESRSTGLLPVITYPLRDYTVVFAIIGAVLASCGIFIQKRRENR
jgi:hypothetical protein